jgi:hypothetical protein
MTAPKRLLESNDHAAMRELLLAGARERPSPRALQSAALALGVSSSVMAGSATATATLASASGGAAISPGLALLAAKWVALGALGGVVLSGGAWIASTPGNTPAVPNAARAAATEHETAAVPRARRASVPEQAATPDPLPETPQPPAGELQASKAVPVPRGGNKKSAPLTAPAVEPSLAAASADLPAPQSLSREIAMIDGARRALASSSAASALQQLDAYSASPRTGTLDREAQLFRIDALVQLGQRAAALPLAQRYLGSYPNDPHAARLRALVEAP